MRTFSCPACGAKIRSAPGIASCKECNTSLRVAKGCNEPSGVSYWGIGFIVAGCLVGLDAWFNDTASADTHNPVRIAGQLVQALAALGLLVVGGFLCVLSRLELIAFRVGPPPARIATKADEPSPETVTRG